MSLRQFGNHPARLTQKPVITKSHDRLDEAKSQRLRARMTHAPNHFLSFLLTESEGEDQLNTPRFLLTVNFYGFRFEVN